MMTRKRMGSATAAIFVLMAGADLPGMATAQDIPSAAASASGSDDAYRYIDDADGLLDAMGTSPPDQGFRFDGIDCWAWAMADGSTILAEPLGDDYRYYVFAPGDDYPFFVGDRTYAYGFEGRTLAAVYGDNGDLVDPSDDIVDGAAWLSERGFGMKRAMQIMGQAASTADTTARAALMERAAVLRHRARVFASIVAVLLILTIMAMAAGHYV